MFLTSHHYIFGIVLVVGISFILGLYLDPVNAHLPQEFSQYIYYYITFVLLFGMQSLDFLLHIYILVKNNFQHSFKAL